jgi:hypothetical protein
MAAHCRTPVSNKINYIGFLHIDCVFSWQHTILALTLVVVLSVILCSDGDLLRSLNIGLSH